MRTGQQGSRAWGLALTVAVHVLLALALMLALRAPRPPQSDAGAVLTVALAPAPARALPAPPAPSELAPAALPELPLPAELRSEAVREETHYYFPEELERQLIVLRDRSGEAEIDLPGDVVMHLFVDAQGRVVSITFEDVAPSPALQEQLRAAFMTMEFLPGLRGGRPVPSRIKIGIAPLPPAAPASTPAPTP